jgi:nitroreductase
MVRSYEPRAVPVAAISRIVGRGLRAPSAGFVQGWGFLVLLEPTDLVRFREAVTPPANADRWLAATIDAPAIIVVHSNKDAYLDRYAQSDKGLARSEDSWPAPYWDIDAGFAAMLMLLGAIDEGLGACFFGLPRECFETYRQAFDVPPAFKPIGAISVGYPADHPEDLRADRKETGEVVHLGAWGRPFA